MMFYATKPSLSFSEDETEKQNYNVIF